jgi:molybdopterin-guanine dinucleotide biosynthesis protein A
MIKASNSVVGIILAGGLARRMGGGDKCLLPLAGKTLLQRTIERAQPQVVQLLLNANGNSLRFARTRLPVLADASTNLGPLAGVLAGFSWMQAQAPEREWLLSFASDTPFFPHSLAQDLLNAAQSSSKKLVVACSKSQIHPVFALWHISLHKTLENQLATGQVPRLQDWMKAQNPVEIDFSAEPYDPFFNINTPQDLYAAEPMAALVK